MYEICYLAVIVSAIVFFCIGALWYNDALLGKAWRSAMGKSDEEFEKDRAHTNMKKSFGLMFLAALIMAFVTAHLVDIVAVAYPESSALTVGLQSGFWVWLGYIATYVLTSVAFEDRPWKYYFINTGYWLVGTLIMGIILSIWK